MADFVGFFERFGLRDNSGKFVAAEPSDELLAAQRLAKARAEFREYAVTCAVPERVVYVFETIDIDEEYGGVMAVAFGRGDGLLAPCGGGADGRRDRDDFL